MPSSLTLPQAVAAAAELGHKSDRVVSVTGLRRLLTDEINNLADRVHLSWKRQSKWQIQRELMEAAEAAWRTARQLKDASSPAVSPPPARGDSLAVDTNTAEPARHAKPSPQRFGVSHRGAEHLSAEWMLHLGAQSARVTRASGDGGVDVECELPNGSTVIVQVKNIASAVPIAQVRELAGVAAHRRCHAAMFTSGTYLQSAQSLANDLNIALFRYNSEEGSCTAGNRVANDIVLAGGYDRWATRNATTWLNENKPSGQTLD